MEKSIKNAVQDRRSYYAIGGDSPVSQEELLELVRHAVKYTPSAFNSQSGRVLVLLGDEHRRLWNITRAILSGIVPPDSFAATEAKLLSFQKGYGTILFFEDQSTVSGLQQQFPLYAENFPVWSLQSSGMLQYGVWMMLESTGFGASLQHYNPLIHDQVREAWGIPAPWKLLGEMPFGKPEANPDPKSFLPVDERIRIFK